MSDFKLSPLENGLDFILSGIRHLQGEPNKTGVKYAILHLSAGIEVILKERLQREHWSLVFDKVENTSRRAFEAGAFSSASFRESLRRLRDICAISITEEQCKELLLLRDKRNRLEHFGIVDSKEALIASASKALNFLIEFIGAQLHQEKLSQNEEAILEDIRPALSGFQVFVEERRRLIKEKLESAQTVIATCTRCGEEAAVVGGEDAVEGEGIACFFCGHKSSPEEAAEEYVQDVLGMSRYETIKDGG